MSENTNQGKAEATVNKSDRNKAREMAQKAIELAPNLQESINKVLNMDLDEVEKPKISNKPKDAKGRYKPRAFKRISSAAQLKETPLLESKKEELELFWVDNFVSETPQGLEVTITPELAHYVVKHCMPRNRMLKVFALNKYARAMTKGEWELNGQSIVVNTEGIVEDGGHRLAACYNSQKPFQTMVNIGQPVGSHKTIDRGAARQLHDDLEFEFFLSDKLDIPTGIKGHTICRKVVSWMKAWRRSAVNTSNATKTSRVFGKECTTIVVQITDYIKNTICGNERMFGSFKTFEKLTREMSSELTMSATGVNRFEFIRLTGAATPLIQYHYLQPDLATSFVNRILSPYIVGDNGLVAQIDSTDPAFQVRKYLLDNRGSVGNGMGKVEELYFRMVSAIHADYTGRKISVLRQTRSWYPDWSIPILGSYNEVYSASDEESGTAEQGELGNIVS